jgi:hypothetical protein
MAEVSECVDLPLAKFYNSLDEYDRMLFAREHIAVNGDFRPWQ